MEPLTTQQNEGGEQNDPIMPSDNNLHLLRFQNNARGRNSVCIA